MLSLTPGSFRTVAAVVLLCGLIRSAALASGEAEKPTPLPPTKAVVEAVVPHATPADGDDSPRQKAADAKKSPGVDLLDTKSGPVWDVTTKNASGWSFKQSDEGLVVQDIRSDTVNTPADGNGWSMVRFRRKVAAPGDFHMQVTGAWSSGGNERAMQALEVKVIGIDGNSIGEVHYADPWVCHRGTVHGLVGKDLARGRQNRLPHKGKAKMEVIRSDGEVSVRWKGKELLSGKSVVPVGAVEIDFKYFHYRQGREGDSFFGQLSVSGLKLFPVDGQDPDAKQGPAGKP
ncbi:MAG: hypothetical protein ACLFV7_11575 [Phycisphaerae bacterium]